jgi:hypothetical protein
MTWFTDQECGLFSINMTKATGSRMQCSCHSNIKTFNGIQVPVIKLILFSQWKKWISPNQNVGIELNADFVQLNMHSQMLMLVYMSLVIDHISVPEFAVCCNTPTFGMCVHMQMEIDVICI